jgi:hypothetical protein
LRPKPQPKLPLAPRSSDPLEVWNDYFSKRKPRAHIVAETLLKLHTSGQHEHVIAAIEAALVNGQSQPWMYDVLAISLQLTKRPAEEVERALLSRVDFTAGDVNDMMLSAAYLTRFEAYGQSLQLYQQASQLDPTRPEPYVMGLKLARRQKDYDAVRWAVAGILTTAWTKNRQDLHQNARDVAVDARRELIARGRREEADTLDKAVREASQRDLVLKLSWAGLGDLDLLVEEPSGTVCSFETPLSRGGGVLVHDGHGPSQKNSYDEYVCAKGVPGVYRIRVRHVWGVIAGGRAVLKVIRYQGTKKETVQTISIPLNERENVVRLSLTKGRRTELAHVARERRIHARRRSGRSLIQRVGGLDPDAARLARQFNRSRNRSKQGGAVGYSPIVQILSEGATLTARAVVSGDRRYVRLNVSPVFSTISDVFTFSIQGGN